MTKQEAFQKTREAIAQRRQLLATAMSNEKAASPAAFAAQVNCGLDEVERDLNLLIDMALEEDGATFTERELLAIAKAEALIPIYRRMLISHENNGFEDHCVDACSTENQFLILAKGL